MVKGSVGVRSQKSIKALKLFARELRRLGVKFEEKSGLTETILRISDSKTNRQAIKDAELGEDISQALSVILKGLIVISVSDRDNKKNSFPQEVGLNVNRIEKDGNTIFEIVTFQCGRKFFVPDDRMTTHLKVAEEE